jgi:hypothetical protein
MRLHSTFRFAHFAASKFGLKPFSAATLVAGTGFVLNKISVSPEEDAQHIKGEHWADDRGTKFINPWASFRKSVIRSRNV